MIATPITSEAKNICNDTYCSTKPINGFVKNVNGVISTLKGVAARQSVIVSSNDVVMPLASMPSLLPDLSTICTAIGAKVRAVWSRCDAVCFDVDSTVCCNEAIDDLAEFCGVGPEVAEVTRTAMNGNMSFRQALKARLDLINPSRQILERFIAENPPSLTPGIRELVDTLHAHKISVYLVTGGFRRIVKPVAKILNIPYSNVFANVLLFHVDGRYAGFDQEQFTSSSGGKATVCGYLKQHFSYKNLVMIGDGATDLETCPPADAFIGFGGNVARPAVKQAAGWFVYNFDQLRLSLIDGQSHNDENQHVRRPSV